MALNDDKKLGLRTGEADQRSVQEKTGHPVPEELAKKAADAIRNARKSTEEVTDLPIELTPEMRKIAAENTSDSQAQPEVANGDSTPVAKIDLAKKVVGEKELDPRKRAEIDKMNMAFMADVDPDEIDSEDDGTDDTE